MTTTKKIPALRFLEFEGEWEVKKLEDVALIGRGKSKHRPRDAAFLYGGKYPFIQTGDIRNAGLYLRSFTQTYSEEGLKQSKLWDEDTLCITIAANIAETTILKIKACFPDSIIGLVPKENVSTVLFVKYQFDKFKNEIQLLSQGGAQDNLNQEKLSNIEFRFPAIQEQQKIASFLIVIDDKIQELTKKKALLEQYKKGVMQQIFNQQIRFKNDNGNDYPEWELVKAKQIFKNYSNKKHNGDLPILAITQDNGAIYRDTLKMKIQSSEASVKSYKIVEPGDFIISLRSFQGGIEYSELFGICSPVYTILKPVKEIHNPFYKFYFKRESFIDQLSSSVIGIRDGKQISYDVFSELDILYPCKEEQRKIASFLTVIDNKVNVVAKELEQIQLYKKGLLQQMFV